MHFDINPSIVVRLGEELISDEVQALIELIKNAYDADSTYAKIVIDTTGKNDQGLKFRDARGYITIEDKGTGMDRRTITEGWLTLSSTLKKLFKERGKKTSLKRTPLGDKGLGRLGAQRLGHNMEILTKTQDSDKEIYLAFSWKDFTESKKLSEVRPDFKEIEPTRQKGTKIIISDLKNPAYWQSERSMQDFERKLSQMISPYEKISRFTIAVEIDGRQLDLTKISDSVRDTAQVRYFLESDGTTFRVKGMAKATLFQMSGREKQLAFRKYLEKDNGQAFLSFLKEQPQASRFNLRKARQAGWFVEYKISRNLSDLSLEVDENEELYNPGPFYGEVDSFDLGMEATRQGIFDKVSQYRKYIKDLAGITVYRSGFGVRVGEDWLELGRQWTGARSYYGLRPGSTLGYIALTAEHNPNLHEMTDREGFVATGFYVNFREMLLTFVRFAGSVQGFLRRSWLSFLRTKEEEEASVSEEDTTESLSETISEYFSLAEEHRGYLSEAKGKLTFSTENLAHIATFVQDTSLLSDKDELDRTASLVRDVRKAIGKTQTQLSKLDKYLEGMADLMPLEQVIRSRISSMREQVNEVWETVSLGITAEALSHEMHNIGRDLAKKAREMRQHLKHRSIKDRRFMSFVEFIQSTVSALQSQLAHLDPSLRSARHKKEVIDLNQYVRELLEFHHNRLQGFNIELELSVDTAKPFKVRMNKGKFTQIINNLIDNSQYWLREDMKKGVTDRGVITVYVRPPFLRLTDSGRGIDPTVETSLFEPFVTTKGRGEGEERGRGLGLFIVQQLLDSEGCSIFLLPDRNKHDRLCTFELDLSARVVN